MNAASTAHGQPRLLIVDDDPKLRDYVGRGLSENAIDSQAVGSAEEALELLADGLGEHFDLMLLDVMLPGLSGWELLERLRARGVELPVVFLTARHAVDERVQGLELGADDFVVKPFVFAELLARVRAVIRRHRELPNVEFAGLVLDLASRTVTVAGRRHELSPREFEVLHVLASARGEPVSRSTLLGDVWNLSFDPGTNVVEVLIRRLRSKIGKRRIQTIPKRGYFLVEPKEEA